MIPGMAPIAYTIFAQQQEPNLLEVINHQVNHTPARHGIAKLEDKWGIDLPVMWCHGYALTKQFILKKCGIKSQLCICKADSQYHMVLLVGDKMLDNLTHDIGPMIYEIVCTQDIDNPNVWK